MYTSRACSFHTNEQEYGSEVAASLGKSLFGKALSCAVSVVSPVIDCSGQSCYKLCTKRDKCFYGYEQGKSICYLSV